MIILFSDAQYNGTKLVIIYLIAIYIYIYIISHYLIFNCQIFVDIYTFAIFCLTH